MLPNTFLTGSLEGVFYRQTLFDLMDISLGSTVQELDWDDFKKEELGSGFFSVDDVEPLHAFQCKPGTRLNYWQILTVAVRRGMSFDDRLHYYRMVMDVEKKHVDKDVCFGTWNLMKEGFSRGMTYGLDQCGHLIVYVLDYSVATGRGFTARLTESGLAKRHEEYASYHYLSDRKNLIHTKGLDVNLPRAYFDDEILRNIPFTIFDGNSCIRFENNGIAKGTIKEQAYESVLPVLFHRPNAKVAVNIVASIEITASLLVGKRGGRIINILEKEQIANHSDKVKFEDLLSKHYEGFLEMLYDCEMEGFIFKDCGMKAQDGNPLGCVYFIGTNY